MKWITTDYKGNKKVWYSEDVINKYRNCLTEIRDLKISLGIKDDALKMINRVLAEVEQ